MKGIINLRGYRIVMDESIHSGKYSFKAQHDRERTFYFYCDTEEAMRAWIKVLIKTTIARDISSECLSFSFFISMHTRKLILLSDSTCHILQPGGHRVIGRRPQDASPSALDDHVQPPAYDAGAAGRPQDGLARGRGGRRL